MKLPFKLSALSAAFALLVSVSFALTGEDIIKAVDANMTFSTARLEARMVIHIGREVRTKSMLMYSRGRDASYAEFLSPPRDKGVKYLKINDNMWMYLPDVDKTIKIAGHMLRQSMMGSDLSYEDALESGELLDKYSVRLLAEEKVEMPYHEGGKLLKKPRLCHVLDLTAKVKDVTYFRRMVWVDKETFVPLKEDLFAMSGKKLKTSYSGDIKRFGRRYYPVYSTMQNLLRRDSFTEFFIDDAQFDVKIDPKYFTQAVLTK